MKLRPASVSVLVSSALVVGAIPNAAAEGYTVAELASPPPPGNPVAIAAKVNNSGSIAGEAAVNANIRHAVRWDAGSITDLGTLPGETESTAYGINGNNVTVGASYTNPSAIFRAAIWSATGQVSELPHLPGMTESLARSVSDNGIAVGTGSDDESHHAVRWAANGSPAALPALAPGKLTSASDISADGSVIVGSSQAGPDNDDHAVVWSGSTVSDLGLLSGYRSAVASATNGDGIVVGEAADPDYPLLNIPVRWINGQVQQLSLPCLAGLRRTVRKRSSRPAVKPLFGLPGLRPLDLSPATRSRYSSDTLCYAVTTDVNQAGDTTGVIFAEDANGNSTTDAVLWKADGTLVHLPVPASNTANAMGINDSKVIVGRQGADANGRSPALRWSE